MIAAGAKVQAPVQRAPLSVRVEPTDGAASTPSGP
jgi:hypothetical protein